MIVITVQGYANAAVHTITVGNTKIFWVKMIDVQNGLGKKNKFDLVRKKICGLFETKNPTKKQIRKYKRSQNEIDKEPNSSFRIKYVRNDLMEKVIKNCRGVKICDDGVNRMEKEKQRKNFRALLGFKEHDIMLPKEYSTKSKIKKLPLNEIIEEQYRVLGYFIDLAFPVHKLGLEVDENGHMDRSEAEEKERQKTIEK